MTVRRVRTIIRMLLPVRNVLRVSTRSYQDRCTVYHVLSAGQPETTDRLLIPVVMVSRGFTRGGEGTVISIFNLSTTNHKYNRF